MTMTAIQFSSFCKEIHDGAMMPHAHIFPACEGDHLSVEFSEDNTKYRIFVQIWEKGDIKVEVRDNRPYVNREDPWMTEEEIQEVKDYVQHIYNCVMNK